MTFSILKTAPFKEFSSTATFYTAVTKIEAVSWTDRVDDHRVNYAASLSKCFSFYALVSQIDIEMHLYLFILPRTHHACSSKLKCSIPALSCEHTAHHSVRVETWSVPHCSVLLRND